MRIQRGGCHPVDGCQDGDGVPRRRLPVPRGEHVSKKTGLPILPPIDIKFVERRAGRLRRHDPGGHPEHRQPGRHHRTCDFTDEIADRQQVGRPAASCSASRRRCCSCTRAARRPPPAPRRRPTAPASPARSCRSWPGLRPGVRPGRLRPHAPLLLLHAAQLSRAPTVVTSAGSNGQLITDIDYTLDRRTGRFAEIAAQQRDRRERRPQPRRHLADHRPPPVFVRNPALVDPDAKMIADKYRTAVAPIANRGRRRDHRRHRPRRRAQRGEPAR